MHWNLLLIILAQETSLGEWYSKLINPSFSIVSFIINKNNLVFFSFSKKNLFCEHYPTSNHINCISQLGLRRVHLCLVFCFLIFGVHLLFLVTVNFTFYQLFMILVILLGCLILKLKIKFYLFSSHLWLWFKFNLSVLSWAFKGI